ncbi:Acyl-CoA thioesterase FadM [Monaibacterium marinum]|uniref:Acyl-CoA thioesterase FadM n=1 Tax=Pontivivens marinum TaxID=1690039 RepID=A0A2C9CQA3_9RHOB|nr:thioesterase family protein [Monaibacterium marinum]SOH93408.1 Acyl-CoA thioesterase FadM [Monaibacterium marinum]
MYPFVRLAWHMFQAGRKPDLPTGGLHESTHICWPWDIDMFGEMNNGRVLSIYDLGRIPWGFRTGLARALRRRGWGLTTAGANVRYRRRILPLRRYVMRSRALGHDERFIYLHQSIWRGDDCHAHVVYRIATTGARRMVPIAEVLEEMGDPDWCPELPEWVQQWIDVEAARPWPPES